MDKRLKVKFLLKTRKSNLGSAFTLIHGARCIAHADWLGAILVDAMMPTISSRVIFDLLANLGVRSLHDEQIRAQIAPVNFVRIKKSGKMFWCAIAVHLRYSDCTQKCDMEVRTFHLIEGCFHYEFLMRISVYENLCHPMTLLVNIYLYTIWASETINTGSKTWILTGVK